MTSDQAVPGAAREPGPQPGDWPPPAHPTAHPAVDAVTPHRAIVLDNRAVIGLSSALADAVSRFVTGGLVPTLVTGPDACLTLPMRNLAAAGVIQWIVQTPDGGFFDAMTGIPLDFDEVDFTPRADRAVPQFLHVPDLTAWQVMVSLTVEHRANLHTEIGGAVEVICRVLTGAPPLGWGLHEPVTETWDRAEFTAFARRRMPTETRLFAVGAAGSAILDVTVQRTERGVEEVLTALVAVGPLDRPLSDVRADCVRMLAELAETETVGFAWTHVRPGLPDLTEPARVRATLEPTATLIGPRAIRALGLEHVLRAPLPAPRHVGRPRVPGLLWTLGADGTPGWEQLAALVTYLTPERIAEVAPQLLAGAPS